MPIDLGVALERHRRGDLAGAIAACETVLAEEPDHPDALHLLGVVALERGDPAQAVAWIGRSVAVRPDGAFAHADLAEAYAALRRTDLAAASARAALGLRPDSPEVLNNVGATLLKAGDLAGALDCLRAAIRLRPGWAMAHNNLGNALRTEGDLAAAIGHFREAVRLDPSAAEPRSNLARALLERGEPGEALGHAHEAVRLRPGFAEAHANLGGVLHALGRLDEAAASFREAVRLKPDLAPAHAGLGGVLDELGDGDGSIASLRESLRLAPRHAGALARLATRLRADLPDPDGAAIEGLLADPALPPAGRRALAFGLAQVRDARGEFGRAAALAVEANALRRADFEARGRGYDPGAHRAFVDRLVATFTPEFFGRVRGLGSESERPVFIVGLPRSGTTLVEQVLAVHPRAFGAGELRHVQETFDAIPAATGRAGSPLEGVESLDRGSIDALARRHLDRLAGLDASADRVVDKMPENMLYLGLIAALFPRATLIHCRRDPRDVALSCWLTDLAYVRWACSMDGIASRIVESRRVMDHWRRVLPSPLFEVDYEAMVADPEATSRALVERSGLGWDPACLAFHASRRPVRTASVAQVRRPVYRTSVGRWKNYATPLAPLFARLDEAP